MTHSEHNDKQPSSATARFAALGAFGRAKRSAARSLGPLAALAFALAALLALAAAPASAAPPTSFCPPTHEGAAGHCELASSVALDPSGGPGGAGGTVYVGEDNGHRVDEFTSTGSFIRAFGWGVLNGAAQLQVCTTACQRGLQGPGAGEIRPAAIAVDPATHDIYASDGLSGGYRVEKFEPSGKFLLTFGKGVNQTAVAESRPTAEQDVCPAPGQPADVCGAGVSGSAPGQIGNFAPPLALDPSGDVWVGDLGRLERFSPTGAFLSEIALPGFEDVGALALDTDPSSPAFEDFYAIDRHADRLFFGPVSKLSSSGALIETLDASGNPVALGLDPLTGNLFVSDQVEPTEGSNSGKAALLAFDSSGAQISRFGAGQVIGHPEGNALAFGGASAKLFVAEQGFTENEGDQVQAFALPAAGPYLREASLAAKPRPTEAILKATLDPEGAKTEYRFQYVDQKSYEEEGGFTGPHVKTTSLASLPADFEEHEVSVPATGLSAETAYRFRLLAENANGDGNLAPSGPNQAEEAPFTTPPPVIVESESLLAAGAADATLQADLNTLGVTAEYRFEYLTEAAYQENLAAAAADPFAGAAVAPVPDAPIGASEEPQSVSQSIVGLTPSTVYRYRVFAHNPGGFKAGPAQAFTTQPASPATGLPDSRQYQLVSSPDKHGALLQPIGEGLIQAAASGDAITYLANAPTEAAAEGYSNEVQILSRRLPSSWASRDLATPNRAATGTAIGKGFEYRFFSTDLSQAAVGPFGDFTPLSPAASEQTPYLRTNFPPGNLSAPCEPSVSDCYRPLVSGCPEAGEPCPPAIEAAADVPPGTVFGNNREDGPCAVAVFRFPVFHCRPHFVAATPDLSHVIIESDVPLTPAATGTELYEWSGGRLTLVGHPVHAGTEVSGETAFQAISADGSRVVFEGSSEAHKGLLLRDTVAEKTIQLDAAAPGCGSCKSGGGQFRWASAEATRIFFTDANKLTPDAGPEAGKPDLYECQVEYEEEAPRCRLTDLTPPAGGEAADAQGVLGASEDGSYLYYAAGNSEPQLYLRHEGATTPIGVLSANDRSDWEASLKHHTARVSPDGRWLAFLSAKSLTGYDNRDAITGKPDMEVYLYHATDEQLVCASCNPTGARPRGIEYKKITNGEHLSSGDRILPGEQGIAALVPGGTPITLKQSLYQSRYLSDSGRLFFNSHDALTPADTNGVIDVYQYEPPGVGGCSESRPTFSATDGGCVDLISSGTSPLESAFLDASETGNDVFFLTSSRLDPQRDIDGERDVYDAHVCSGESPCIPAPPPAPPLCAGDSCQLPATPPSDATPGSLTFNGAGDVVECPKGKVLQKGHCVKRKSAKHHKKHHSQHRQNAKSHRRAAK